MLPQNCDILNVMKFPNLKFEKELWRKGYRYVCGIDEVGRGSWAGPVVATAVIFGPRSRISKDPGSGLRLRRDPGSDVTDVIRDSKQLSSAQRERLDPIIKKNCLAYAIAETSAKTINREGIVKATQRAFRKCLKEIKLQPDFVLVDAFYIKYLAKKNQKPIIKGDQKSITIAAASIIAKVYRDNLMVQLHETEGRYRFDLHKGYGTKIHQEAIRKHSLSAYHRIDFVPEELLTQS